MIKKLFNIKFSYKKLIIYSIVCGIVTGIIPLISLFDNTSIHNIAECYEMWVFLAMIIILNADKPIEAGIKTFIFFLISQPLCYLVQVPFYEYGFQIFKFYPFWLKLTILTLPGGMIAWYTKKENVLSIIILSVANFLLSAELVGHFQTLIESFPQQLLAVLFIIFEIILFINVIFKSKIKRIICYITIPIFVIFTWLMISYNASKPIDSFSMIELPSSSTYSIVECDNNISAEINNGFLKVRCNVNGTYIIKILNDKDEIIEIEYIVEDEYSNIDLIN